jgi:hypothetical protein
LTQLLQNVSLLLKNFQKSTPPNVQCTAHTQLKFETKQQIYTQNKIYTVNSVTKKNLGPYGAKSTSVQNIPGSSCLRQIWSHFFGPQAEGDKL